MDDGGAARRLSRADFLSENWITCADDINDGDNDQHSD
jgi:hypothetical protein